MWRFHEIGVPPQIIHFHAMFYYKPSIWGYPHGYGNPYVCNCAWWKLLPPAQIGTWASWVYGANPKFKRGRINWDIICIYIYVYICKYIYIIYYLSIYLLTYLSIFSYVCLFACLSVYLFAFLLFLSIYIYTWICWCLLSESPSQDILWTTNSLCSTTSTSVSRTSRLGRDPTEFAVIWRFP